MNIFVLALDPVQAAIMHCDKHILKMSIEYAQLLSTAKRELEGTPVKFGRRTFKLFDGESLELMNDRVIIANAKAYKATHVNHPCARWARRSTANYNWLFALFCACLDEYTHRYGKVHACSKLKSFLAEAPSMNSHAMTQFELAMPDEYKHEDPVLAYRAFYIGDKSSFAKWCHRRTPPDWYVHGTAS